MIEIGLSRTQIEDSQAALAAAVDEAFSHSDQETGYYQPDQQQVPRPSFDLLKAQLTQFGYEAKRGRFTLEPKDAGVLGSFEGLRGFASFRVQTGNGVETITGPAIVLPGGNQVGVLTAEAPSASLSDMQHALLDSEYVKHLAKVSKQHSAADVTNAGDIGPSLVVASSRAAGTAHIELHTLAPGNEASNTFGSSFSADGRQDIVVGHDTRTVRSIVRPADAVIMILAAEDQLPSEARLFDVALSASELAVGMTLASTASRLGRLPDVAANLSNMVGA